MRIGILVALVMLVFCCACSVRENSGVDSTAVVKVEVDNATAIKNGAIQEVVDETSGREATNLEIKEAEPVKEVEEVVVYENIAEQKSGSRTLRWSPKPGLRWHWQLSGDLVVEKGIDVYDVDLFETDSLLIEKLHQDGARVICYFSAGSIEDWRDDASKVSPEFVGKELEGWPGEKWLDVSRIDAIAPLLLSRLDLAAAKGCDGVEPDNVDGFEQDTEFVLAYADQIEFNRWLAGMAHERNLAVGLKNDLEQVGDLVHNFDFAVNEECFEQNNCEDLVAFVRLGKAVFGAEYTLEPAAFCSRALAMNFSWIRAEYDLDRATVACG